LDQGPLACPEACLGYGDCHRACPFGAIGQPQEGCLPPINSRLCRGCGECLKACPRSLMVLRDRRAKFMVACRGSAFMKEMDKLCPVGCLGCGRCRKACPAKAVAKRGLQAPPTADEEKCAGHWPGCGQACQTSCPRNLPGPVTQNR
jgi:electron transport complex protein RnfB